MFTVLNAIVLRDLPVPNPQQLYAANTHRAADVSPRYSWPYVEQAQRDVEGRAELFAATPPTQMQVRLPRGTDAAERSSIQLVSGSFFAGLRQRAQLGRLIEPRDASAPGSHPVMVISDGYWQRRFQRDPGIVGRELIVGGASLTVIGITAPGFFGPYLGFRNPDVWIPLTMQSEVRYAFNASTDDAADNTRPWTTQPGIQWLSLFARIADAANVEAVGSALTLAHQRDAASRLTAADGDRRSDLARERVVLSGADRGVSFLRGDLSSRLFVLLAMVGVLLAITCGNVASLLVARASAREREIAVRTALGAGRWRVVRQLLIETWLLSAIGGALGLLVAAWGRDVLLGMFTGGAAIIDLDIRFDWRVLLFAVTLTMICGLAAGILPALRSTRIAPTEAIKAQSRQVGHAGGRRGALVGKSLVTAQMAFCLLLLVVAGLFIRSMQALVHTDVGFDRDRLLVARMDVRSMGYADGQRQALYDRVLERLRRIPGVESASLSLNGPLGTSWRASSLTVEGYTAAPNERLMTNEEFVSADYFATVGLAIVEGRGFTPADARPGGRSTIINQTMARRFFPNASAIGRHWTTDDVLQPDAPVIVGVVEDAKYIDVRDTTPNMVYRVTGAAPAETLGNLEVRASGEPSALAPAIRDALAELEPALAGVRPGAARSSRQPRADQRSADCEPDHGVWPGRAVARLPRPLRHDLVWRLATHRRARLAHGARRRSRDRGMAGGPRGAHARRHWRGPRPAARVCGRPEHPVAAARRRSDRSHLVLAGDAAPGPGRGHGGLPARASRVADRSDGGVARRIGASRGAAFIRHLSGRSTSDTRGRRRSAMSATCTWRMIPPPSRCLCESVSRRGSGCVATALVASVTVEAASSNRCVPVSRGRSPVGGDPLASNPAGESAIPVFCTSAHARSARTPCRPSLVVPDVDRRSSARADCGRSCAQRDDGLAARTRAAELILRPNRASLTSPAAITNSPFTGD